MSKSENSQCLKKNPIQVNGKRLIGILWPYFDRLFCRLNLFIRVFFFLIPIFSLSIFYPIRMFLYASDKIVRIYCVCNSHSLKEKYIDVSFGSTQHSHIFTYSFCVCTFSSARVNIFRLVKYLFSCIIIAIIIFRSAVFSPISTSL